VSEVAEILEQLDLESYLDHVGIQYRTRPGSSGRQLNIKCCPSCGDSNWKVYANESTGLGNCFKGGCELSSFNKWKFVKSYLGSPGNGDVVRHIKEAAAAMGWRPKKEASAVSFVSEVKLPTSIDLPDPAGQNLEYLEKRGITADTAKYFSLKYCHAGGYVNTVGGSTVRQDYSQRVVIPVFDLDGVLRTFQGRDITGKKEQKYLFPPGLNASGRFLYNAHNAWHSDEIVVGEGAFDVMAIHLAVQAFPDLRHLTAVGTFGMHLSSNMDGNDQIQSFVSLMRGRLKRVVLMWDGEPKAIRGAIKASEKLRGIGLSTRIAILPKGKDPNEISAAEIRSAYYEAVNPEAPGGMGKLLKAIMF
jgi:DNA primase